MGNFTIPRLAGGTLVVLLGVTLVLPGIASSSSAATPRSTVAVMRSRVVSGGRAVVIAGSGLPPGRTGEVAECSSAAPQPTVVTHGIPMPVSCTRPRRVRVGGDGALSSVRFRVVDGVVGPPSSGIDSWGNPAGTDAQKYPCPPSAPQASAGASCYFQLRWGAGVGDEMVEPLTFAVAGSHPTEPATGSSDTTPVAPHVAGASAVAHHVAAAMAMAVTPSTDLTGGQTVVVTATGLPHSGVGEIRECNNAFFEPIMWVGGVRTPVSCSDPKSQRWVFTAQGILHTTFTIVTGTVGPPRAGHDNLGDSADVDAARYPCPPTAAEVAEGFHCYLELEWGAGITHRVVVPITFASPISTSATITKTVTASKSSTAGVGTSASPNGSGTSTSGTHGNLPFTGASIEPMALAGVLLVILGTGLLVGVSTRRRRRPGHEGTPVDTH